MNFDIGIETIEYCLGSLSETGEDLLITNPEWNLVEIEQKTGIKSRHIVSCGETASDLAFAACEKIFSKGVERESVDALLFVSQSPDYFLPTTACLLQARLKLPTTCFAYDINLGCSGFVYGMATAAALINGGLAKRVLLVCSDTYSKYIDLNDRTCRPIFSDGAAASLITAHSTAKVGSFIFGTDGLGGENLMVKGGASRDNQNLPPILQMNGQKIYMFTLAAIPGVVNSIIEKAGIQIDEIDLFVFHQASALVLNGIARALKIPNDKMYANLQDVGNTVSATIPIALKDAVEGGKLKAGMKVLICGFGVGYSWGGALIEWNDDFY